MRKSKTKGCYSIIEWASSPSDGLTLLRLSEGQPAEPVQVTDPAELLQESHPVCFRATELLKSLGKSLSERLAERLLDADYVARVILPTAESHDLFALCAELRVEGRADETARAASAFAKASADKCRTPATFASPPEVAQAPSPVAMSLSTAQPGAAIPHPPVTNAATAARVWLALVDRLNAMPLAVLSEMERLMEPIEHPLKPLIAEAAAAALRKGFGVKQKNARDLIESGEPVPFRAAPREPAKPTQPLDLDAVCRIFEKDGALAGRFDSYEYRPEQLRMVREVGEAFNDDLVLMVEAGTGTGKSLAYLVPAILWAVRNRDPVVISTNTKNLQAQLCQKDLPFLQAALGGGFKYALIKGRANYLCARKLLALLANAERELARNERLALLPVISWLAATRTGDVAENSGLKLGMQSELWPRISTQQDECLGPGCRHSRHCFVRRARALSQQADVIVANHATIFSEADVQSVVLPEYRRIIFDEAHNLEDVATEAFTVAVTPWVLPRILSRLYRGQRDGAGRGLFANFRFQLSRAAPPEATKESLGALVQKSIEEFPALRSAADALFFAVAGLFRSQRSEERLRYDADRPPDEWYAVSQAIAQLREPVLALALKLDKIKVNTASWIEEQKEPSEELSDLSDAAAEIGAQSLKLGEVAEWLDVVLKADDPKRVYWAQGGGAREGAGLYAAPLEIGAMMEEMVFGRARTAIFTSATLTAGGKFDFMRDRLGIRGAVSQRVREADLGTCFDFPNQALLTVPAFLPDPGQEAASFVEPFSRFVVDLLTATHGRGLVLFTAHATLRDADKIIRAGLGKAGIAVMTQGVDGERARLISRFARDTSSVLLGTQSFWEGVDVPGESLSVLVVAKLPFRSHTDPLVSARCDLLKSQGRNPFYDYMVPDAVIRLKQGVGRLIRSKEDRGVVVLCDSRVVTKSYGKVFTQSLPIPARVFKDAGATVKAVAEFLER